MYERIRDNLVHLKLNTAESLLDSILERAVSNDTPTVEVIDELINIEVTERKRSAIDTRTKLSGIPVKKTLADFDFSYQPMIDMKLIDDLRTLRFVSNQENVIFLGPPGVGKTHLAIGLAMEAVHAGFSVYYVTATAMIEKMKMYNQRGNLEKALKSYCKYKVLIIDEIGYLPMDREGSYLFFQLISRRYEKGSTIFTSNKAYSEWGEVLGDSVIAAAVLDRILHHSVTVNIKGESYRLMSRRRQGLTIPPPAVEAAVSNS